MQLVGGGGGVARMPVGGVSESLWWHKYERIIFRQDIIYRFKKKKKAAELVSALDESTRKEGTNRCVFNSPLSTQGQQFLEVQGPSQTSDSLTISQ
jgi:hypothetical protein